MAKHFDPSVVRGVYAELIRLRDELLEFEKLSDPIVASGVDSGDARNLLHYIRFCQLETSGLSHKLRLLGLNTLDFVEPAVLPQINAVICALEQMDSELATESLCSEPADVPDELFGNEVLNVVTMPDEAAVNYQVPFQILKRGTKLLRVSHRTADNERLAKMIRNCRRAAAELQNHCLIMLDVNDSSIRIGEFQHHTPAIKVEPERNEKGQVVRNAEVIFATANSRVKQEGVWIQVEKINTHQLKTGDVIYLRDSAERSRKMVITEVEKGFIKAETDKTIYFDKGIRIMFIRKSEIIDHATIAEIPSEELRLSVKKGETVVFVPPGKPGSPKQLNSKGEVILPSFVSCSSVAIFSGAKTGQRVYFGEKQAEGIIESVSESEMRVKITKAQVPQNILMAGVRLYFPDSEWDTEDLTPYFQQLNSLNPDLICISVKSKPGTLSSLASGGKNSPRLVVKIDQLSDLNLLSEKLPAFLSFSLYGIWVPTDELIVGQDAAAVSGAISYVQKWCRAARIECLIS